MPLVKYIGNANPGDGAARLLLEKSEDGQERALVLGGEPLEVSDDEFARLRSNFMIEEVDEKEAPQDDTSKSTETQQNAPTLTSQPAKPLAGTTPGQAAPATPSASGFTTNPTTPASGN